MPYPICSVVAVFKMLIRILNTLRSRIWDILFFLFSDYPKSTLGENGNSPQGICFLLNCSWYSKEKRIFISLILFRCAKRFILPDRTTLLENELARLQSEFHSAKSQNSSLE